MEISVKGKTYPCIAKATTVLPSTLTDVVLVRMGNEIQVYAVEIGEPWANSIVEFLMDNCPDCQIIGHYKRQ